MFKSLLSVLRAQNHSELCCKSQRILFYTWNIGMLLLSSVGICLVSLTLALGMYEPSLFLGYFRVPLIFLLNFLPILILQLVFLSLFNRQWLAFFLTAFIVLAASIGNFYTLKLRGQAFDASLVGDISAGLQIASNYDLSINSRIIIAVAALILGSVFMFFFVKGRISLPFRASVAALCLLSLFPLWKFVYSDEETYTSKTYVGDNVVFLMPAHVFASKGFVYPFIYSFAENGKSVPEGYSAQLAEELLSRYSDAQIPSDKTPHVMIFQMESFFDFESLGVSGIDPSVYEKFRSLQAESISGTVLTNVIGGGTLKSEQCFLTGNWTFPTVSNNFPSYVWYMKSQGYSTSGVHPHYGGMYNRKFSNPKLGFEEYVFFEDYFEEYLTDGYFSDHMLFPYVLSRYENAKNNNEKMFSFNVTMQGHGPYNSTELLFEPTWAGNGTYAELYHCFNNYLGSVRESLNELSAYIDALRHDEEPVVVMIYGDHPPHLTSMDSIHQKSGINIDQNTKDGWYNYYGTPYLIWANEAAKELYGKDFAGEGEDTSICYLMNILFNELEWTGPAFMQFTENIRQSISVAGTNGQFIENGKFTTELSENGKILLDSYKYAEYYLANDYTFNIKDYS